jgi:hypothetical protein
VGRELALVDRASRRSHRCSTAARSTRPLAAARSDALGLAAWGCPCLVELKTERDPATAMQDVSRWALAATASPLAALAARSALDEQVLALP